MKIWALLLAIVMPSAVAGSEPPITALAFAPDGKLVVVGSQAGLTIRNWPALTLVRKLPTELSNVHDLQFSPNGKLLAAAGGRPSESGSLALYEWPDGSLMRRMETHKDVIYSATWRSDSKAIATASADRTIHIHDVSETKPHRVLEGHSRAVLAVLYLSGDAELLSAGVDESLRVWDAETGRSIRQMSQHTQPVLGLALRPGLAADAAPMVASIGAGRPDASPSEASAQV